MGTLKQFIFLYGPSGSGKSTAGIILGDNLNLPFVDLDDEIQIRTGMDIPEIFSKEGESGFRRWEAEVLQDVLGGNPKVIALGGGTLTLQENNELVKSKGSVLVLGAPHEILLSRLESDSDSRPLLNGDVNQKLRDLVDQRRQHYQSFRLQVDTNHKTPQEVVWDTQIKLGRYFLRGMADNRNPGYEAWIENGGLEGLGNLLADQGLSGPICVVTDEHVGQIYLPQVMDSLIQAGYSADSFMIPPGETHKNIKTITRLWDFYLSARLERSSTVIALGGGIVGDLVGFSAATYMRGISWVVLPTSLLSMVDACVGGKTGADLPPGKNLIGAFHPPSFVLVDPEVLSTLPDDELRNGMAEVIKHGIIDDPILFSACKSLDRDDLQLINKQLISRAMAVKIKFIERDPYEKGLRAALNFGHTVGHGIESGLNFTIRHGEAISIGMVIEARLAEQIGLAVPGLAVEISTVVKNLGLPDALPDKLEVSKLIKMMKQDKKVAGGIVKFALPAAIGQMRIDVEVKEWETLLKDEELWD